MNIIEKLVPEAVFKMSGNCLNSGYYGVLRLPGIPSVAYSAPFAHPTAKQAKEFARQVMFTDDPIQKQTLITFVTLHLDLEDQNE